jgi:DNA-binding NarL/FixJ family response regulator
VTAPLVILPPPADVASVAEAVGRTGARAVAGWRLPSSPWDLAAERIVCIGEVQSRTAARDALVAAARGAGVIAVIDEKTDLGADFGDDLTRIGPVQRRTEAPPPLLPGEQRRLLELVAGGRSIPEAAVALFVSVRTAERRMGEIRRALGVRTTAEAVQAYMASRSAR